MTGRSRNESQVEMHTWLITHGLRAAGLIALGRIEIKLTYIRRIYGRTHRGDIGYTVFGRLL